MAAPVTSAATFPSGTGITYSSQVYGEWVQVHDNASETVQAGSVLLNPRTYSSTTIHPLVVTVGTRVRLIAEMAVGTTLVTTSPVVRVFGADRFPDSSGAYPTNTTFWRLDNAVFNATGVTLTLAVAGTLQQDATSVLSNPSTDWNIYGAKSILVLPETAGAVSGGANTLIPITAQILNF